MGTHSKQCLTVKNTTEANATQTVYISEMCSKGRNKSIFFPLYFRETCYFTFFFPRSSIQKLTAALSAEARRPDERCRKETKEGEIRGQGNRRSLPRLLITSRVSATYSHFAFIFYHPDMVERRREFDPGLTQIHLLWC